MQNECPRPVETGADSYAQITAGVLAREVVRRCLAPISPLLQTGSTHNTDAEPFGMPMNARRRRLFEEWASTNASDS